MILEAANYHLHSNMSLFKCRHRHGTALWILIYIPICLYLNRTARHFPAIYRCIYIPICLYLNNHNPVMDCLRGYMIYIPICLYLNAEIEDLTAIYLYLHSNMSLFKYITNYVIRHLIRIYIPICLYLNGATSALSFTSKSIYIPICLYLNLDTYRARRQQVSNLHSNMSLFKSCRSVAFRVCDSYLHSNMSLFKLTVSGSFLSF